MVPIPKFLHFLHGRESTVTSLSATYSIAFAAGLFSAIFLVEPFDTPTWLDIILCILLAEAAGGIVANVSHGTQAFYAEEARRRWSFIGVQSVLVLLIWYFTDGGTAAILGLGAAIILTSVIVVLMSDQGRQRSFAGALTAALLLLASLVFSETPFLSAYFAAFTVKLVFAFAVKWS